MRVLVFAGAVSDDFLFQLVRNDDFIIAVDGSFDFLYEKKIKINLVVGDFDSLKLKEELKKYEFIKLNTNKDETDTKWAINKAYELSNNVCLVGGIKGNRIEHFLANLNLLRMFPNLSIIDDDSFIFLLKEGKHSFSKNRFKYISFFSYKEKSLISIENFKYPLSNYWLHINDSLCISNELLDNQGILKIYKGEILVIFTKNDNVII